MTIASMSEALSRFCSPGYPGDSLLRQYNVEPFAGWEPRLRRGADWLGVYSSAWEGVSQDTKDLANHGAATVHLYVAVGWSLPHSVVDQLMHVLRANPGRATWTDVAARKEWGRAEQLSRDARAGFISQFFEACSLRPRDGSVLHTDSDVLRASPSKGGRPGRVSFYSGCAPTSDRAGGLVSMTRDDPAQPLVWFHGPVGRTLGGDAWRQPGSHDGFPTLGPRLSWADKHGDRALAKVRAAGYGDWGRAALAPVALLPPPL